MKCPSNTHFCHKGYDVRLGEPYATDQSRRVPDVLKMEYPQGTVNRKLRCGRTFTFENVACRGSEKPLKTKSFNLRDWSRVLHDCICTDANFVPNLQGSR